MSKVLTDRTADRLMRLLNSSGSASARGASFADRLWAFARCDSAAAVGGNAILAECYPATLLKPVTRSALPPEEHPRGVLLTLLGEDGESAAPAVGRCYAVLIGDEVVSDRAGSIAGRVRVFGVESGGGGSESLGCHLERDGADAIAVTPASLAGDGLEEVPGETEEDCPTLAVKVGCHLELDGDGAVAVTPATLAGAAADTGLVAAAGEEDCETLSVDPEVASTYEVDLVEGVTPSVIEEDEEEEPIAAIRFVVAKRHHYFRMNAFGVVILAEGQATPTNTTTLVTFIDSDSVLFNADAAARTIEAVVNRQMSIVTHANGIKLDGDADDPGNSKYYGTNAGGAKGWYAIPSGDGSVTLGCHLELDGDGAVAVTPATLAGAAADTGLVAAAGDPCRTLAVDLEAASTTAETVVTDVSLSLSGGTLTLAKTKTTFTNHYNAAGLLIERTAGTPAVTTDVIDLCAAATYCADPDREMSFGSSVACAASGGEAVLTGGDSFTPQSGGEAVLTGGGDFSFANASP